jgi:hypothetical protein
MALYDDLQRAVRSLDAWLATNLAGDPVDLQVAKVLDARQQLVARIDTLEDMNMQSALDGGVIDAGVIATLKANVDRLIHAPRSLDAAQGIVDAVGKVAGTLDFEMLGGFGTAFRARR